MAGAAHAWAMQRSAARTRSARSARSARSGRQAAPVTGAGYTVGGSAGALPAAFPAAPPSQRTSACRRSCAGAARSPAAASALAARRRTRRRAPGPIPRSGEPPTPRPVGLHRDGTTVRQLSSAAGCPHGLAASWPERRSVREKAGKTAYGDVSDEVQRGRATAVRKGKSSTRRASHHSPCLAPTHPPTHPPTVDQDLCAHRAHQDVRRQQRHLGLQARGGGRDGDGRGGGPVVRQPDCGAEMEMAGRICRPPARLWPATLCFSCCQNRYPR